MEKPEPSSHPRRPVDGLESLGADVHDAVVSAIRAPAPDLEISCSTQEDIDLGVPGTGRLSWPVASRPVSFR